jgi:hypothetical protein
MSWEAMLIVVGAVFTPALVIGAFMLDEWSRRLSSPRHHYDPSEVKRLEEWHAARPLDDIDSWPEFRKPEIPMSGVYIQYPLGREPVARPRQYFQIFGETFENAVIAAQQFKVRHPAASTATTSTQHSPYYNLGYLPVPLEADQE